MNTCSVVTNESIKNIAHTYDTPFYLYDAQVMKSATEQLRGVLPSGSDIYFSIKANPLIGIAQFMRSLQCKAEVASDGEMNIAFEAGFVGNEIIFSGPGKTEDELLYAIEKDISYIMVESIEEMEHIDAIGHCREKIVKIGLRINPDIEVHGSTVIMGGASQFGIDEAMIDEAIKRAMSLQNVKLCALHFYLASQLLSIEQIVKNAATALSIYSRLHKEYKLKIELIDFGGGFGIPYYAHEDALDMDLLRQGFAELFEPHKNNNVRYAFESGRFLLAEAGIYVTKVLYQKKCKGENFIIVDGGSHHHASSAFLGRYVRHNFPIDIITERPESCKTKMTICGKQCAPTDVLAKHVELPQPDIGDLVVVYKSGAYGLTMSPILFLSNKTPSELLLSKGKIHVLRPSMGKELFSQLQNRISEDMLQ